MEKERAYQYWLHNLPGIGDRNIEKLLKQFKSAEQIYHMGIDALRLTVQKKRREELEAFLLMWDVEEKYEELLRKKIHFIPIDDKRYPERLRKLEHPPYALYCLGNLPEEQAPSAAIIGARECSEYGSYVAEAFARRLAQAGVSVISGMARGIDGISQQAALLAGGRTYAVLGSGVDVCYPASNRKLYEEIRQKGGGILSSFPPGTQPVKWQFCERNRIVAGLSDLVLVVEARLKSGTSLTVDMALEQGKSVYAVPGRLTDRLSDGCNYLLRQGAEIALTPEDIISELAVLQNRRGIAGQRPEQLSEETSEQKPKQIPERKPEKESEGNTPVAEASEKELLLLSFLDAYPKSADEILRLMRKKGNDMELPYLLEGMISLCMKGLARQTGGNYFSKICSDIQF